MHDNVLPIIQNVKKILSEDPVNFNSEKEIDVNRVAAECVGLAIMDTPLKNGFVNITAIIAAIRNNLGALKILSPMTIIGVCEAVQDSNAKTKEIAWLAKVPGVAEPNASQADAIHSNRNTSGQGGPGTGC